MTNDDLTTIDLHQQGLSRRDFLSTAAGATGIGLLRTEFMLMNRPDLPDEEEQFENLKKLVQKLDGRPLTVRTLDVGGEKLATALGDMQTESANPALGLRAVRCVRLVSAAPRTLEHIGISRRPFPPDRVE